ncbi:hypothetical protein MUK42_13075 [Musa troglodytarum]|uniref:Uncharacterized protein n=1 Tax=Musa troglodytarum TaxID=320322 RepID=A0A9E7GNE5_9LILI|nr:hypothetical protein MUK42_13075 [Musa troglodytarum]
MESLEEFICSNISAFKDKDNHIGHIEDREMRFATESTETHHLKEKEPHRITPGTLQNGNFSARAEIHHNTTTRRNHPGIQNARSKRTPRKKVPDIAGSGFEGRRDAVLQSSSNTRSRYTTPSWWADDGVYARVEARDDPKRGGGGAVRSCETAGSTQDREQVRAEGSVTYQYCSKPPSDGDLTDNESPHGSYC